jgi:thiol-disulfide isomerase/thioredoxin
MRNALRGTAFGLTVIVAASGGFLGYRSWQAHRPDGTQATPTPGATPVPAADQPAEAAEAAEATEAAEAAHPAVPDTVPDLTLPDAKGQQKSLRDYLGHPVIINFWATWCAPCRREIPLLLQLRQAYRGEHLEVVGIAVDFQAAVAEYLQKTPIAYPLLVGQDQGLAAAEKFGMEPVLPFSVFADATGRVIAVKVGELHKNEADYIVGAMRQVAAGKESIQDARAGIAEKLRTFAVERAKAGNSSS